MPFLLIVAISKKKYRGRIWRRFGFGLPQKAFYLKKSSSKQTIWIHALSVGEVTSALPLVKSLKQSKPETNLVFSASTRTGKKVAEEHIAPFVDLIIDSPLDFLITIKFFLAVIKPQLFILVETDFWPNWLNQLKKNKIPALLVNGRISEKSYANYKKYDFFFKPLFHSFAILSMQTKNDTKKMLNLGLPQSRLKTLGNLKFDTANLANDPLSNTIDSIAIGLLQDVKILLCGSTHKGEEIILLKIFKNLQKELKNIALIIAPRDIDRADEIQQICIKNDLQPNLRSQGGTTQSVLILDSIGELASLYQLATVAFIGGSLVNAGGHNPLEATAFGVPTLFGPHMEDFSEIAADLNECGAGKTVNNPVELQQKILQILSDSSKHKSLTTAARAFMPRCSGVTLAHVQEINKLLGSK